MTAKELFKEIGWKLESIQYNCFSDVKVEINNCVVKNFMEYRNKDNFDSIYFDFDTKIIHFSFNGNRDSICMGIDFIQAINKQVEELGWGKEEENE